MSPGHIFLRTHYPTTPALLAYRTAPQVSTGQSPFFLLYGRDAQLPTALDFFAPTIPCPAIETDYAQELFQELKRARELARKSIQKAQGKQKVNMTVGHRRVKFMLETL